MKQFSGLLVSASLEFAALWLSIALTYSPYNPNKLVGVMLGCGTARRAVQWSLLIESGVGVTTAHQMMCAHGCMQVGSFEEVLMRMSASEGNELAAWSQVMFVAPGLLQSVTDELSHKASKK